MDKKEQEKQKENKNEIDSKFKSPYIIKTRNKHPEVIDRADLFKDHNLKEARNGIVFKVNRDSIRELALMRDRKKIQEMEQKLMPLLKEISEKINEYDFDVPLEVMYNLLLDFSNIFETPSGERIPKIDINDKKYYLQGVSGPLHIEFIEKIPNKKLVYQYDFFNSPSSGEKGKLTIEFIEPSPGSVKLKVKNEIHDLKPDYKKIGMVPNLFGRLGPMINWILPKILAKQIQTIIYEKSFDDLTMGNYRILQAKLNAIGKDIDKLKAKYFEVKAPLSLNSFECSECGATLNITSKEAKFIICEHCSTPFLMEWQKG